MSIQSGGSLVPTHRIRPHKPAGDLLAPVIRVVTSHVENASSAGIQATGQAGTQPTEKVTALVERMLPVMREDLAQLHSFVTEVGLEVAVSLPDSGEVYVVRPPHENPTGMGRTSRLIRLPGDSHLKVRSEAPVFDPDMGRCAVVGLLADETAGQGSLDVLLRALVRTAARSISERWFRIRHRKRWILAAASEASPENHFTLALDNDHDVVGADHYARELLARAKDEPPETLRLSDFLQLSSKPFPSRPVSDMTGRAVSALDGSPWLILLTPPDLRGFSNYGPDALVHARPRFNRIQHCDPPPPGPSRRGARLTPGMQRKLVVHIDAQLQSALRAADLARQVGLSTSYFSRVFSQSMRMTPHKYVMWRRISRAEELIRTTDLELSQIALICGFADQSHLTRYFHQQMGAPPYAFRRNCR